MLEALKCVSIACKLIPTKLPSISGLIIRHKCLYVEVVGA